MSKNATNAPLIEPARQQLVIDPRSPPGWRLVDLPGLISPPGWWSPGVHSPAWSLTLVPAEENPDRVLFDHDTGRIWIVAGRDEFNRRRRPKPFVFGLQNQLRAYELAMALDDRHPYWKAGDGAKDEDLDNTRRGAISLSPRCQKFFDTIIAPSPGGSRACLHSGARRSTRPA